MTVCPSCLEENAAGARFCNSCGAPLEAPAAPAREERKVVTVLFADLVGFTARAEQLDPEDVRALLGPYYAYLPLSSSGSSGTLAQVAAPSLDRHAGGTRQGRRRSRASGARAAFQ